MSRLDKCVYCGHRLLHHRGANKGECLAYGSYPNKSPDDYYYEQAINTVSQCKCNKGGVEVYE